MKVLFSQLKKYLPKLTADVKEVADVFTMTGFMLDKLTEVNYNGQRDYILDLEVRQNRADSLGVWGLAKELSAYYKIPFQYQEYRLNHLTNSYKLPIIINAKEAVKRVMAIKFIDLEIKESPTWLKEYLAMYDINSINNLVDITNYVMIETGHASHVFDIEKVGDTLIWEINNGKYAKFTTLNGQEVELSNDILLISNNQNPLSLSFIGGEKDAVSNSTKKAILEMAVYNGTVVRRNARTLKISTEAGSRLEKFMDPESLPLAFDWLVSLVLEMCGGSVVSEVFDEYIQRTPEIEIQIDLDKVQQVAGIPISYTESKEYLEHLGFKINKDDENSVKVLRPINRLDIEIEQDVFEEIIRMKGFKNIPSDNLSTQIVKDITPSRIKLIKQITNLLVAIGFDEVRSWVLVNEDSNFISNFIDWDAIKVSNSINEEVPFLRQSIAVSLIGQASTYKKNNITPIHLFEIGKIFGKKEGSYQEINSLGLLIEGSNINKLKFQLEILLRQLGFDKIEYNKESNPPKSAHPLSTWSIRVNNQIIGIIYISNSQVIQEASIAEINLDLLDNLKNNLQKNSIKEVTQKIIDLDTNIILENNQDINSFMLSKLETISNDLWSWSVIDVFKLDNKTKYTIRVSYINLTDPKAKELHAKIFN